MTPLQIDTHISLGPIIILAVSWLATAAYQIIKSKFDQAANEKRFKDIEDHHKEALQDIIKKLDHLRTRAAMDINALKEAHERQITDMREAQKETSHEMRELRDIIMGLCKTIELKTVAEMRRSTKNA